MPTSGAGERSTSSSTPTVRWGSRVASSSTHTVATSSAFMCHDGKLPWAAQIGKASCISSSSKLLANSVPSVLPITRVVNRTAGCSIRQARKRVLDGGLAGGVVAEPVVGAPGGLRRHDADDRALGHVGQQGGDGEVDADEVGAEGEGPLLGGELLEGPDLGRAGGEHHQVDGAERGPGLLGDPGAVLRLREVGRDDGAPACGGDQLLERLPTARGDGDLRTAARRHAGDVTADAGRCADHENLHSVQVPCHGVTFSCSSGPMS